MNDRRQPHGPLDDLGVGQLAKNMMHRAVEVLNRRRPIRQLERVFSGEALGYLAATAAVHTRSPYIVRTVLTTRPDPDCVEVAMTIAHGRRTRAVAARLENRGGRWRCVEFMMLGAHTTGRGVRHAA